MYSFSPRIPPGGEGQPATASGISLVPADRGTVTLDIGCGKGRFLCARAAAHPEGFFIGIDCLFPRLERLARRAGNAGLRNISLWHGEAHSALLALVPPRSIAVCTLFFSDPWPKRRHHRRRVVTPAFLDALHRVLIPAGTVYLATDDTEYYQWIRRVFASRGAFQPVPALVLAPEQQTDFEHLFKSQNRPVMRCGYRKQP